MKNNQRGITLVALVITIIVLLILAGVTIAALSGDNGILTNASKAQQENALGNAKDQVSMAINEATNAYYEETYVDPDTEIDNVYGGDKQRTAINFILAIPDPADSTIEVYGTGTSYEVQIKTDDNKPAYVKATIGTDGSLGQWSTITASLSANKVSAPFED